jgi:hypothetical protein
MDSVIGFHCNACGKCCNTPPAMSVRELFLHRDRFIGTLAVGQLDPNLPDRLQDSVLLNRRTAAAYMGASCIKPGAELPYRPLVQHRRVAEAAFHEDLQRRRSELEQEKQRWGRAVAGMLENELNQGSPYQRFGGDAYLVLPVAPVLAVLAAEGESMRVQCVQYIDAQLALIGEAVDRALARKRPEDRPGTVQLRNFAHAYARQRTLLASRVEAA